MEPLQKLVTRASALSQQTRPRFGGVFLVSGRVLAGVGHSPFESKLFQIRGTFQESRTHDMSGSRRFSFSSLAPARYWPVLTPNWSAPLGPESLRFSDLTGGAGLSKD